MFKQVGSFEARKEIGSFEMRVLSIHLGRGYYYMDNKSKM
jgi:hypothetical protein